MNKSSKDASVSRRVCSCMQMHSNSSSVTEPAPGPNIKQTCGMHTQSHSRNEHQDAPDLLAVLEERMHQKDPLMPAFLCSPLIKPEITAQSCCPASPGWRILLTTCSLSAGHSFKGSLKRSFHDYSRCCLHQIRSWCHFFRRRTVNRGRS